MELDAPPCPLRGGAGAGAGAGGVDAGGGVDASERLESLGRCSPGDVHILVVDDERLTRLVVANLLRKCAYQGASPPPRFAARARGAAALHHRRTLCVGLSECSFH